jgi:hypothetical protein
MINRLLWSIRVKREDAQEQTRSIQTNLVLVRKPALLLMLLSLPMLNVAVDGKLSATGVNNAPSIVAARPLVQKAVFASIMLISQYQ